MKIRLTRPNLTEYDICDLTTMCTFLGWELIIDSSKGDFKVISNDDIAYIQKHDTLGVNLIWRTDERIQFINQILEVAMSIRNCNAIPDEKDSNKFKESFITGIRKMMNWIPGVTYGELYGK